MLTARGSKDNPSNSDKNKINASNWMQYFSTIANFIQWWLATFKTDPPVSGNGNSNGNSNGNGNGNTGTTTKKTTSTTTPARTTTTPAATTRAQSTPVAQVISVSTTARTSVPTSPATSAPASSSHEPDTSVSLQTTPPASGSNSATNSNTSKSSSALGNGEDNSENNGSGLSTNGCVDRALKFLLLVALVFTFTLADQVHKLILRAYCLLQIQLELAPSIQEPRRLTGTHTTRWCHSVTFLTYYPALASLTANGSLVWSSVFCFSCSPAAALATSSLGDAARATVNASRRLPPRLRCTSSKRVKNLGWCTHWNQPP